jgi:hypothetical protein
MKLGRAGRVRLALLVLAALCLSSRVGAQSQQLEDEIVANLAGGRVIVHVAKENIIIFSAIDQPLEAGSVPPRVADVDNSHIGILFGASEWKMPAAPKPVRLDRDYLRIGRRDPHAAGDPSGAEPDLETIGVAFLETLRPLVSQLHHKIDIVAEEPLFEMVIIGFAPNHYGPEVWTVQYRIEQEQVGARDDYWQTRILRPRFEQLYPPEKKAPRTLVETRYPLNTKGPTLQDLIDGNEPRVAQVISGEPRFAKVAEFINRGQANKAPAPDAIDFLRALLPLVAGKSTFLMGKMEEEHGLEWVVPPSEPVQKTKEDKNRPPEAPSLRRRPDDN